MVAVRTPTASAAAMTGADVVARSTDAIFGRPLVVNIWRGIVAEALLDLVLPDGWTWCSADYAPYDFLHADGARLEVKQSAARQSWTPGISGPSKAAFDIAHRKGHWDGAIWTRAKGPIRHADLYVMAHHAVADDTADHRDPHQWTFYVVITTRLPVTRSLSLKLLRTLAEPVGFTKLAGAVEAARKTLPALNRTSPTCRLRELQP